MSGTEIAIIEGSERETELIRERVLSPVKYDQVSTFETAAQFQRNHPDTSQVTLLVADLLEYYEDGMPDEEVYGQLTGTFDRLLMADGKAPYGVLFLTKVPSRYIKESLLRSSNLPHSEDGIRENYKSARTVKYAAGNLSIAAKPYELDKETGKLLRYYEDAQKDIEKHINATFDVQSTRQSGK